MAERVVVCGIGNRLRGDDATGVEAVESLMREVEDENVLFLLCESSPENFIGSIERFAPDKVVIVDAVDFGKAPGYVSHIDLHTVRGLNLSTHKLPLTLFLDYLQKKRSFDTVFIGVQPKRTGLGEPMSMECMESMDYLKELILKEIGKA